MTDRDLHLIGDSTLRQLFILFLESVGVRVPLTGPFIPPKLKDYVIEKYNATVHYSLHGPPVLSSLAINFSLATFTADVIDAIPANGNEIILISTVHHFAILSSEGYRQRLMAIVDAIRCLRQRKLDKHIPIVFRTANPRGNYTFRANSYRLKSYNEIAIDTFVTAKLDVIVYDIYDMVSDCPYKPVAHLPDYMMTLQIDHILSLVCPLES